jgi:hypothetical protein
MLRPAAGHDKRTAKYRPCVLGVVVVCEVIGRLIWQAKERKENIEHRTPNIQHRTSKAGRSTHHPLARQVNGGGGLVVLASELPLRRGKPTGGGRVGREHRTPNIQHRTSKAGRSTHHPLARHSPWAKPGPSTLDPRHSHLLQVAPAASALLITAAAVRPWPMARITVAAPISGGL